LLEQAGSADLVGRLQGVAQFGGSGTSGYHLRVTSSGSWSLFTEDANATDTVLASGSQAIGTNTWHTLSLNLNGSAITASIDGAQVASVTSSIYNSGQVGLLVSKWVNAQFDNLSVTTPAGSPARPSPRWMTVLPGPGPTSSTTPAAGSTAATVAVTCSTARTVGTTPPVTPPRSRSPVPRSRSTESRT